ncbi:MAG: hypothetical protein KDD45_12785, partial [Bdellovibrionales bacterium]|nr:hypothetical protein [Bdellovibrionales bacterium]
MSSKLTVKKILILIAFFLFGFASTYIFDSFTKELRQDKISSILFKSKLGKQLSFVNVQLEFNKLASKDTDTTEINAYITLLKTSTGEINYKWSLPEGVQIISGTTEGQLTNITAESPQQLSLV